MRVIHPPNCSPRRAGAAVVEVALILPLFLLVVFGIVEFGRALMVGQLITNGSRFGAREAVIDGSTNSSVESNAKTYVADLIGVPESAVNVIIEVTPAPANPDPGNVLALSQSNDLCTVTIEVNYDDVAYVAGRFLKGTKLRGKCSMRRE